MATGGDKTPTRRNLTRHQAPAEKPQKLFDECEKLQYKIMILGSELWYKMLDCDSKQEIKEDLDGLGKRKDQLAVELGLK